MSPLPKIVIIGGGGHAKVVIELIRSRNEYEIVGILDPQLERGTRVLDVEVLGSDAQLDELLAQGVQNAAVGLGSWGDNSIHGRIFKNLKDKGYHVPALIHQHAIVSNHVAIGEGSQIMAGAVIQPNTVIGSNTVINTGSIIEHDCRIGDGVYTGSRVACSGFVTIGNDCFIGSGVTIIPQIKISKFSFIAAGAVVVSDIEEAQKVRGVPAKVFQ